MHLLSRFDRADFKSERLLQSPGWDLTDVKHCSVPACDLTCSTYDWSFGTVCGIICMPVTIALCRLDPTCWKALRDSQPARQKPDRELGSLNLKMSTRTVAQPCQATAVSMCDLA